VPDLIVLCAGAARDRPLPDGGRAGPAPALGERSPASLPALPHLARALRRAVVRADDADDAAVPTELPHERWLRDRCAVPPADSIAAFAALRFGVRPPAWRVTPVHVQVGHDRLVLADPAVLALEPDEAAILAEAIRPLVAEAGFGLVVAAPLVWFFVGDGLRALRARNWALACGRNIDAYLPEGEDARRWRRLLTEVQTTWFEHAVNRAREAAGRPAVNALWLDGRLGARGPAGAAEPAAKPWPGAVFTRDPALAGLALAGGAEVIVTEGIGPAAAAVSAAASRGDVLIDVDAWRAPARAGDAPAWRAAWSDVDAWLATLGLERGGPGGFGRVGLVFTGERRCVEIDLDAGRRWRFWRRFDAQATLLP